MQFVTDDIHALAHTGFHFSDGKGDWIYDKTGTQGRLFKDPYPVSEELFIATRKPKGPTWDDPEAYDLVVARREGQRDAALPGRSDLLLASLSADDPRRSRR